jgi:hypothetical protein
LRSVYESLEAGHSLHLTVLTIILRF